MAPLMNSLRRLRDYCIRIADSVYNFIGYYIVLALNKVDRFFLGGP